jgi:hypothetical protein
MQGARVTLYSRSQLEVFARFGACSRWDGLTEKLTLYSDDARSQVCVCDGGMLLQQG